MKKLKPNSALGPKKSRLQRRARTKPRTLLLSLYTSASQPLRLLAETLRVSLLCELPARHARGSTLPERRGGGKPPTPFERRPPGRPRGSPGSSHLRTFAGLGGRTRRFRADTIRSPSTPAREHSRLAGQRQLYHKPRTFSRGNQNSRGILDYLHSRKH